MALEFPQKTKVLISMCEREKSLFLPSTVSTELPHAECLWVNSRQFSDEEWLKTLEKFQPSVLLSGWSTRMIPPVFLQSPHLSLRYICHIAGTVRHIIPRSFIEKGGIVTNWGNMAAPMVAEHALLLVLASLRKLPQWNEIMKSDSHSHHIQKDLLMTRSLFRKKVGLHGFGNVARTLLQLLKPFQVECFVYSKNVPHSFIREHEAIPCENLKELFKQSEVLVECEALTPETQGSVSQEVLECLQKDAVFVNVGRGALVDESALARLAVEKKIFVASDVFCVEPLPLDSPFFETPQTLLSPHIAGPTQDSLPECTRFAFKNITNFIEGKPLENLITLEAYDRST